MIIKNLKGEVIFDGKCASLRGADLRGADLRGADLWSADLLVADLRGACLRGANLSGAIHNLPIFRLDLCEWDVSYCYGVLQIGCQTHGIESWKNFSDGEIANMDKNALYFWKKYKDVIMDLCEIADKNK